MKAITLHQPFASLIVEGHKHAETRSWAAPSSLVGRRIAIHAAKRPALGYEDGVRAITENIMTDTYGQGWMEKIPRGAVVGTAILSAVVQVEEQHYDVNTGETTADCRPVLPGPNISVAVDSFGDFSVGRYLWLLKNVIAFSQPVAAKGAQGFWNWQ